MNILIGNYNNYYNRQVKEASDLEAYEDAMEAALTSPLPLTFENVNFNPNDGVTTELILGKGAPEQLNINPDYLVCYGSDEAIISRWFILDANRTRGGQWKFTLRRDVLIDFGDAVETAPIYVEKAIINDLENPLLCNNEGLVVNQIKKQEILLKDKSAVPWLVMYLKKRVLGTTNPGASGVVTLNVDKDVAYFEELNTPIAQWQYFNYQTTDYEVANNIMFNVYYEGLPSSSWDANSKYKKYQITDNGSSITVRSNFGSNLKWVNITNQKPLLDTAYSAVKATMKSQFKTAFGYQANDNILIYNGKVIKDSAGKYFKITVFKNSSGASDYQVTSTNAANLKNTMTTAWNNASGQSASPNNLAFTAQCNYINYRVQIDELTDVATSINFSDYTGDGTQDNALFDAICMPYGTITEFVGWEVSQEFTTSKERSLAIMNSLAAQLSDLYVLDLQVLPYCPIQDVLNDYYEEEGKIAILDDMIDQLVIPCYDLNGTTDILLVCTKSQDITFDIKKSIAITDSSAVSETFKRKYVNDCTLFRLCSPNYNGLFEFNLAKNGGKVEKFNVDLTLKPYNPYIHVNPDFNFLYGYDFNDVRGLVCNGDFSLGIINDAWVQYEIQNKNYQAIFDRQIQNLDINNKLIRTEAAVQAGAGMVQGAVAGAAVGNNVGGYFGNSGAMAGTALGAMAGAGMAMGGGIADMEILGQRQGEARKYAIDNYTLSLGNVRALPVSITKTSALTANNKLFPFVEIYECSEEEKEAYYLKLRYDGMTIGKIDTITKYRNEGDNFFKGQVIRLPDLKDDNHVAQAINEEIMKGVYI